jgi:hypothetical protein
MLDALSSRLSQLLCKDNIKWPPLSVKVEARKTFDESAGVATILTKSITFPLDAITIPSISVMAYILQVQIPKNSSVIILFNIFNCCYRIILR